MDASCTATPDLTFGETVVVRDAAWLTASAPGANTRPVKTASRSANASLPSVRGTVMAAFGAIATLGCAAAIGLVSIAGSAEPNSPGSPQPLPTVQAHLPVTGR